MLAALLASPVRWDMVRFLGSPKIYRLGRREIVDLVPGYRLARIPGTHGGAHAYLLTLHAACVLLRHTERSWVPIDTLQGRCWTTGLESLVVHPAPLHTDEAAGSTIGDARFDKTVRLTGWSKALFPVRRFWFKLCETAGKRYVYWSSRFRDRRARNQRANGRGPPAAPRLARRGTGRLRERPWPRSWRGCASGRRSPPPSSGSCRKPCSAGRCSSSSRR